eukprot:3437430-Amphidinium_carterae.1
MALVVVNSSGPLNEIPVLSAPPSLDSRTPESQNVQTKVSQKVVLFSAASQYALNDIVCKSELKR